MHAKGLSPRWMAGSVYILCKYLYASIVSSTKSTPLFFHDDEFFLHVCVWMVSFAGFLYFHSGVNYTRFRLKAFGGVIFAVEKVYQRQPAAFLYISTFKPRNYVFWYLSA
jgi:hypothetical protein